MNMQSIAPQKQSKKRTQSRFQRLWAEAEGLAKENLKLEKELDVLVQRIDSEVFKAERELGETIREVVYRQLDFAQKKSLLKWQRAELSEWIDDNLSELVAMGLLDEPLQNKLAELRATELGIELDQNSELSPVEQLEKHFEDESAQFRRQFETPAENNTTADLLDEDEEDDGDGVDDCNDTMEEEELAELLRRLHEEFDDHDRIEIPEPQKRADKLISDAVFKRLFRQTATALHPDKESNEERRREKHGLMSQLLKARKEYDLITILQLHEQHAMAASELNGDDQQELEQVLVEYLNQQQRRLDEIVHQSPMHHMAFTEFYHMRPATVTRRINAHVGKIGKKRQGLLDFIGNVKTLKRLKEVLAERYESHVFRGDWF